jgi:hypothetical protein
VATKAPQLIQHYVTSGDRSLKAWHDFLRKVTFGAALVLMLASVVSLHWAANLIGLRGPWEPVAWAVPLAMEIGMAAVASTATTIRKAPKPGHEHGGYYISLWLIFSFVMLLAQLSNIGHAITTVAANNELPAVIPVEFIYIFASAFAALFPLGGTMFVHVSGFLRERGTGARWIDGDSEVVYKQVADGAPATQSPANVGARAPQPASARTTPTPPRAPAAQPARAPRPTVHASDGSSDQARARVVFDRMVAENPHEKPDAAAIQRELNIDAHPATPRRWVNAWWSAHEQTVGGARDPIADQLADDVRTAQSVSGAA